MANTHATASAGPLATPTAAPVPDGTITVAVDGLGVGTVAAALAPLRLGPVVMVGELTGMAALVVALPLPAPRGTVTTAGPDAGAVADASKPGGGLSTVGGWRAMRLLPPNHRPMAVCGPLEVDWVLERPVVAERFAIAALTLLTAPSGTPPAIPKLAPAAVPAPAPLLAEPSA